MMLNVKKARQGAVTQANTLVRSRQNLSMMQKRLFLYRNGGGEAGRRGV